MLLESKQFLKGSGELLSPAKKAELDTKMSNLEARWGRLQAELDNRYMRLVRIHEKLTKFEELLHPFLVCLRSGVNHFWDIRTCYSNFDSKLLLLGYFRGEKFLKATFNFQFLRFVRLLREFFSFVFLGCNNIKMTAGQNVSLLMWLRWFGNCWCCHNTVLQANTEQKYPNISRPKPWRWNLMWTTNSRMRPRVPLWVTVFWFVIMFNFCKGPLDTHRELHLGNLHATNFLPEIKWVGSLLEKRHSVVRFS